MKHTHRKIIAIVSLIIFIIVLFGGFIVEQYDLHVFTPLENLGLIVLLFVSAILAFYHGSIYEIVKMNK